MDFGKVIFMTDLDGTLLTDDKRILDKDMAAIERFRAGGGIFTIATGRGYSMAKPVAEKLGLDVPAVVFNGAAVFDFAQDRFLWQCEMGAQARRYIERLTERFPEQLGVEVLHEQNIYVPFLNRTEIDHLALEKLTPNEKKLEEIPDGGWLKVLFAAEPSVIDEVAQYVSESGFDDVQWVRSAPVYFECLPKGVDKSTGFRELIRLLGAEDRFTVASGDFMNDTHMIQQADLGAAVASAQDSVKQAADIIVCDNNSGAIAEIIEYLERS
ncbi:MAG: Cof-type HAD-IIB family hydrolase [Oscillospiraceae bacterium]